MNTIIMTRIFKYYVFFIFLSCVLVYSLFVFMYYLRTQIESFNTVWNPIADPNHVQSHKNEISYLNDWISILDRGKKPLDAQQMRYFLKPKETHLQWHIDRLPKPPLVKQTKFLFF